MREINVDVITDVVSQLCIKANLDLNHDISQCFEKAVKQEDTQLGKYVMDRLIENADIAKTDRMPICQDTGMAVVFVDLGQDVHVVGGLLDDAINKGVAKGYTDGYLRKSVVSDPINRKNTGDNTPAIIHYNIVEGDKINIAVVPKGFGSENMSRLKMMVPADGIDGVKDFVVETVKIAGPNPCPPIVVGVGVGGTFEKSAILSKKALLRDMDNHNPDPYWAAVESQLLERINDLDIGPAGFGGKTTALGVKIETFPTHIAGLPVAVNISCHATRHAEREI